MHCLSFHILNFLFLGLIYRSGKSFSKIQTSWLKGQSNEIFDLQFFFHNSNKPVPLTNGFKYFWIWLSFCWFIRIFVAKKLTLRELKKSFSQESFA